MDSFRSLLDALCSPSAVLNHEGVVLAANDAWSSFDLAGGFAGKHCPEGFAYAAWLRTLATSWNEASQCESIVRRVLEGVSEGGAVIYEPLRSATKASFALRFVRLNVGDRPGVLLIHTDSIEVAVDGVTFAAVESQRVRFHSAENRLREAQLQQRGLLDSIPDIAWLKDAESRFIAVNKPCADACGMDVNSIVGKSDLDCWVRELAERYREDDRQVIASRQPKRVEEPFEDQHGKRIWIETVKVPILNDAGEVIGTAGVARDITERKSAEEVLRRAHADLERLVAERTEALHQANAALLADIAERQKVEEQQRRLVAILEATTDFVGIANAAGTAVYVNRAGRKLVGIDESEDIETMAVQDFHPSWVGKLMVEVILPSAERDGVWSGETALISKTGEIIPVLQVVLAHRDAKGQLEFISTIARDIRERKQWEQQLLQSQKMEAIGRLAGGIAHDFNNLMTAVLGYGDFAMNALSADDPARAHVAQMTTAAERASQLTRQLLAFARKQIIEPRAVDLNRLITDVHEMLNRVIGERVELVTKVIAAPASVRGDANQLQQILVNLAINARDAMPDGGRLTIQTSNVNVGTTESFSDELAPGSYVLVSVTDTGLGMPKDVLEHVFEPFFTTKDVGKGTGLGLATCYGIVKQARGHIDAESTMNVGTTFRIYLPAATEESVVEPELPAVVSTAKDAHETILLVEDEPALLTIATQVLRRCGYNVITARDGREAVRVAGETQSPIHLLLTDIVMPQLNGHEAAELIRKDRPNIRVLYMSGYTDAVEQGFLPEGAPFLSKPFTPPALAARVLEALTEALTEELTETSSGEPPPSSPSLP